MIRTVLFDADRVLINSEFATIELERLYGVPQQESQKFFELEWDKCLTGEADSKEVIKPYLKRWKWPGTAEDYLKFWFEFEHKLDIVLIDYIQRLRASGVKCYVATDQDKHRTQYMLDKMGFRESFDSIFASSHLGVTKLSTRFFKLILEALDLPAKEVLFWDDDPKNVKIAHDSGLNAEIYTDYKGFERIMLQRYGLVGL